MTSQAMKKQMKDCLVAKLEGSDFKIEPVTKEIVSGINSNYVHIGDKGLVLSVDQYYPDGALQAFCDMASHRDGRENIAFVFLKDEKSFFRSGFEKCITKRDKSFKNYSPEKLCRVISFRPEEIVAFANARGNLQYYQPQSDGSGGIVSYKFRPIWFSYSHINEDLRYKPNDGASKTQYIWDNMTGLEGALNLGEGILVERPKLTTPTAPTTIDLGN